MSRSLFLLIAGLYSCFLGLSMLFLAGESLKSYGVSNPDQAHISVMQYLGLTNIGLGILSLLNRHVPNSAGLRNALLTTAFVVFGGVLKGLYDVFVLHPPMSGLFLADTVLRLGLGLGLLYFLNRERQQAIRQVAL
ncbi:hypothetical protein [Rudanella lutea]|uniref:hypothetical protein n=1 Tax=Rudanella lutea TaxID=451374 RepID=UPI00039C0CB8|nr:hypothetical protein [Rudanella lutea]